MLDAVIAAGIDYPDVIATLTRQGIEKFQSAWRQVAVTVAVGLVHGNGTQT